MTDKYLTKSEVKTTTQKQTYKKKIKERKNNTKDIKHNNTKTNKKYL